MLRHRETGNKDHKQQKNNEKREINNKKKSSSLNKLIINPYKLKNMIKFSTKIPKNNNKI